MENVGALTFRGLDAVLGSLSEIGYNAEWQDIRASDMGAPHRRERIWIVAYADDSGKWRNERESEIEADAMADTRLQRQAKHEEQTERQSEQHRGDYWSTEPAVGMLVDGLPFKLVGGK